MSNWNETTLETFNDESVFSESPFGESLEPSGETEWDSPFGAAETETTMESGEAFGQDEYGQEAYAYRSEAESPFASEQYAYRSESESPFGGEDYAYQQESEVLRAPNEFPPTCDDVTFDGKKWPHGLKNINKNNPGEVSAVTFVPHAEVYEFHLSKFDVDRHELKDTHKQRIRELSQRILAGVRANRFSGDPIRVYTYGEASSTALATHNLPLSRNRAFNALNAIRCAFKSDGITYPVVYGLYGTGEQHARIRGPNDKEDPQFRGVVVRAFAPLKACEKCRQQPPKPPPTGTTAICVSVPRIAPRVATRLPPDIIPLAPIIPGLRLPIAIVTKAQATVRVDDRRSRQSRSYTFTGWGLEVALPPGRTRIDLQAELRATLEVLVKASAQLGARLQLGPLKLTLRVDVSVFAQLIVKLCTQLRLRLDLDLGKPNVPDLRACRLIEARNVRTPVFPFPALQGPGVLVVPGAGYGPAVLTFMSPSVQGLGLATNVVPVPADKGTVKTLLALGGTLQLAGAHREAEFESEWPEAFGEMESELAPFV